MSTIFSSDLEDDGTQVTIAAFGERPVHELLGGGRVADVLLWRDKLVSAGILAGTIAAWFLFKIVEYSLVTFVSQIAITTMLVIFIWSNGAQIFHWNPPNIPNIILQESTLKEVIVMFQRNVNLLLSKLLYVAYGNDMKLFCLTIFSLSILSTIGNSISTLNLLFIGILGMETLPFVYEQYEQEFTYLARKMIRRMMKIYKKFDANVLGRIPRGPMKQN